MRLNPEVKLLMRGQGEPMIYYFLKLHHAITITVLLNAQAPQITRRINIETVTAVAILRL